MRTSGKEASDKIRLFEALVYLVATAVTIYLTVEEWRIRQAIAELRSMLRVPDHPKPIVEPTPREISDLHREARSILEEEA